MRDTYGSIIAGAIQSKLSSEKENSGGKKLSNKKSNRRGSFSFLGGMQTLVDTICKQFSKDELKLESKVLSLSYSHKGISASENWSLSSMTNSTSEDRTYDAVIMTAPLSNVKEMEIVKGGMPFSLDFIPEGFVGNDFKQVRAVLLIPFPCKKGVGKQVGPVLVVPQVSNRDTGDSGEGAPLTTDARWLTGGSRPRVSGFRREAGGDGGEGGGWPGPLDRGVVVNGWEVSYVPISVMITAFKKPNVKRPLEGFGVLIPSKEQDHGLKTVGTLFSSMMFPDRAPSDLYLYTTFIGGSRNRELAKASTDELKQVVCSDLRRLLGVEGDPTFVSHIFWSKAFPLYGHNYDSVLRAIHKMEQDLPGFFYAGNHKDGLSVGKAIASGCKAAELVISYLDNHSDAKTVEENEELLTGKN
ncbi:hypothetical protein Cgig2_025750 [Carnegiea gigantea]|uniref:Amine oxidase domain-containing protein n=1 Tax=Carnegiea gigantea TaxID=171969 RepID=A0A9Q1JM38_9CARY|nr:hypothetical protein Cgig2_025750 [Carnegiea gigantea]